MSSRKPDRRGSAKRPFVPLRRPQKKEKPLTPTQAVVTGLALVASGVLFWVAVASFPEVDWEAFRRLPFLFVALPVVGVVLVVIGVVQSIRSRLKARADRDG